MEKFVFLLFPLVLFVSSAQATTYTVNTTSDSSDGVCDATHCSLREAIDKLNYDSVTPHTVQFSIDASNPANTCDSATGVCTISPTTLLSALRKGDTTVDGYTQPGSLANTASFPEPFNGVLRIVLNGSSSGTGVYGDGLLIRSSNNLVRGLVIQNFSRDAVSIHGYLDGSHSLNNKIQGCYIGTDYLGVTAKPNSEYGVITYENTGSNTIGTDSDSVNDAGERNVIAASLNNKGFTSFDTGDGANVVAGNNVGIGADGVTDLGNAGNGIVLDTSNNFVTYNLISGNSGAGIVVDVDRTGNIIANNIVGLNYLGDFAVGNSLQGIMVRGPSNEVRENTVSGNAQQGIFLSGDGNVIQGNLIGTSTDGTVVIANGMHGIGVLGDSNIIGTDGDGMADDTEGNVIAGNRTNATNGVSVEYADNNIIAGNTIGFDGEGNGGFGFQIGVKITGSSGTQVGTNGDGVSDDIEKNVFSTNSAYGIYIVGGGSTVIAGNYIGTNLSGDVGIGNTSHGIKIESASTNNRIGSNLDGVNDIAERNVISGNGSRGIVIYGANSNTISGNFIGVAADGTTAMPNADDGVRVTASATDNTISYNTIAFNGDGTILSDPGTGEYGILIDNSAVRNYILANSIYVNNTSGISLETGGNIEIVAPTIDSQSASTSGTMVTIAGSGTASGNEIQVYIADPNGQGQGFLGTTLVEASKKWNYSATLSAGVNLVALETDSTNNTSEFSVAYTVQNEIPVAASTTVTINVTVGSTGSYDLLSTFSDPNGDVLSFNEVGSSCNLDNGTLTDGGTGLTISCGTSGFTQFLNYTRTSVGQDRIGVKAFDGTDLSSNTLQVRFR